MIHPVRQNWTRAYGKPITSFAPSAAVRMHVHRDHPVHEAHKRWPRRSDPSFPDRPTIRFAYESCI